MSSVNSSNFVELARRTSATATEAGCQVALDRIKAFVLSGDAFCRLTAIADMAGQIADAHKRRFFYGTEVALPISPLGDAAAAPICKNLEKDLKLVRLLHAALGLLTEAVEFLETVSVAVMGKGELDTPNLVVELGDSCWYVAEAVDALSDSGLTLDDVLEKVIEKLRIRFPDKFTEFDAINRDLQAERAVVK